MPGFPKLHGGAAALNFVDTLDPRIGDNAEDFLTSPESLTAWAEYAGVVDGARVTPAGFRRAIELREALYRVFVAVAHGRQPARADLARVHDAHATTFESARLVREGEAFRYGVPTSAGVDAILWPVLESAMAVLASPSRIKECPGEDCGWVFLDTSRNGTRRWCSMAGCGSREKMRRYRARVRD